MRGPLLRGSSVLNLNKLEARKFQKGTISKLFCLLFLSFSGTISERLYGGQFVFIGRVY